MQYHSEIIFFSILFFGTELQVNTKGPEVSSFVSELNVSFMITDYRLLYKFPRLPITGLCTITH